jgi:hypothetical protein
MVDRVKISVILIKVDIIEESTMSKFTIQQQVFLFLGELTVNPNVPASVQEDALALQTKMGDYASMQLPYCPSEEEFVAVYTGQAKKHPCATLNPKLYMYTHKD